MKPYFAIILSAVMLFAPMLAQATEIRQFDRLDGDDQITFVDKLIDSVEAASQNSPALLAKVKRFFMDKQPGEAISGMGRFELNLSLARIADLQAVAKDPKARRVEVEDVMYVTLYRSGIDLDKSFRPAAVNFQAQKPLGNALTMDDANKALAQTQTWINRTVDTSDHTFSHGGPESLSGFTDNQKAIAFFMALAAVAVVLGRNSGPSAGASSPVPASDPNAWWLDRGFTSMNQALGSICRAAVVDSTSTAC